MKKISVLGSTGSIGVNTLQVVSDFPDDLCVNALAAGSNLEVLAEQIIRFRPRLVSISRESEVPRLRALISRGQDLSREVRIVSGTEGLRMVAAYSEVDTVVCAISGSAGLIPTLEGLRQGKNVALATKEALVMAGKILMEEARRLGTQILPIDSEHNAIHQCLRGEKTETIRRLILTASGGPFRTTPLKDFDTITPKRALQHPTWRMGPKITIDSATLMNKGLEVIEAHWLFGVPDDAIEILIHPQSTVHSMVELIDGSIIAQLGVADMRGAIQYVLTYPERRGNRIPTLDLADLRRLEFEKPDFEKFPCIRLAYDALREGGTMPAVMNAANEVAVQTFLEGGIRFSEISELIEKTMLSHHPVTADSLETVLEADLTAREKAEGYITEMVTP